MSGSDGSRALEAVKKLESSLAARAEAALAADGRIASAHAEAEALLAAARVSGEHEAERRRAAILAIAQEEAAATRAAAAEEARALLARCDDRRDSLAAEFCEFVLTGRA